MKEITQIFCRDTIVSINKSMPIRPDDVHIWWVSLDSPPIPFADLLRIIDKDERSRSERFRFERHWRRYVTCHGMLRFILSQYVKINPAQIEFFRESHGKPFLIDSQKRNIEFNISRSEDFLLLGIALGCRIGVDVEYIRSIPEMDYVLGAFFSKRERTLLNRFASDQRQDAFFTCWTLKEAYLKAVGYGLSQPVEQFDASFVIMDWLNLSDKKWYDDNSSVWLCKTLDFFEDYKGIVVVEDKL